MPERQLQPGYHRTTFAGSLMVWIAVLGASVMYATAFLFVLIGITRILHFDNAALIAAMGSAGLMTPALLVGLYRRARRASAARSGIDDLDEAPPTRTDFLTAIKDGPLGAWAYLWLAGVPVVGGAAAVVYLNHPRPPWAVILGAAVVLVYFDGFLLYSLRRGDMWGVGAREGVENQIVQEASSVAFACVLILGFNYAILEQFFGAPAVPLRIAVIFSLLVWTLVYAAKRRVMIR